MAQPNPSGYDVWSRLSNEILLRDTPNGIVGAGLTRRNRRTRRAHARAFSAWRTHGISDMLAHTPQYRYYRADHIARYLARLAALYHSEFLAAQADHQMLFRSIPTLRVRTESGNA